MRKWTGSLLIAPMIFSLSSCASNPELMDAAIKIAQQAATSQAGGASALSIGEISAGLKEALKVGSNNVVQQLGVTNGFNADPAIHIPLPRKIARVRDYAAKVGLQRSFDDLETRLNRAAEAATPHAKELFYGAITQMTLSDARGILQGPSNAATNYFRDKMNMPLAERMRPIVNQAMAQAGVVQAYDNAVGRLGPLAPAVPDYKSQLTDHVVQLGMDGIFHYLAQEEAAIRNNPAKRVTDILRRVFG